MREKTDTLPARVGEIRRQARQNIALGAVTASYAENRERVVDLLNEALATEIVCVLRYRRHYFAAQRLALQSVADEFLAHANEELAHVDRIAGRISQLNGEPDFDPSHLSERSHSEYVAGVTLAEMIREDLVAERVAIDSYRQMISEVGEDSTTRRMLEEILENEEEHAEEMADLLAVET